MQRQSRQVPSYLVCLAIVATYSLLPGCKLRNAYARLAESQVAPAGDSKNSLSIVVIPPSLNIYTRLMKDHVGTQRKTFELKRSTISWKNPVELLESMVITKFAGQVLVDNNLLKLAHPIGHFQVRLECEGAPVILTGQTGGGDEFTSALDGVGSLFRIFPGYLDDDGLTGAPNPIVDDQEKFAQEKQEHAKDAKTDYDLRLKNGGMGSLRFNITAATCKRLTEFLTEYRRRGAQHYYSGHLRPRRFEGAGCSAFAMAFLEIGQLLKRSEYTKLWAQTKLIDPRHIGNAYQKVDYPYGSNLLSRIDSKLERWPEGKAVPAMSAPIAPVLDRRLVKWEVPVGENRSNLPFTIYDPELTYSWLEALHAAGGGIALGRTWRAETDGKAEVLVTDAYDAEALPKEQFFDPTDSLFDDPNYEVAGTPDDLKGEGSITAKRLADLKGN